MLSIGVSYLRTLLATAEILLNVFNFLANDRHLTQNYKFGMVGIHYTPNPPEGAKIVYYR